MEMIRQQALGYRDYGMLQSFCVSIAVYLRWAEDVNGKLVAKDRTSGISKTEDKGIWRLCGGTLPWAGGSSYY